MEVKIVGDKIVIEAPLNKPLVPSGTGKSLNLFTSSGVIQTNLMHEGKPVKVGLNIFISSK